MHRTTIPAIHTHRPFYGASVKTIQGLRGSPDYLPYHAARTHLVTTGGLERLRLHSAGSTFLRLWPTGSSLRWPSLITAWYFSSSPSDSISRWTPCPPGFPGPRVVTPGFGYESPNPRLSGTLTHLTAKLPRTHYGQLRLPYRPSGTSFPYIHQLSR